MHFRGDWFGGKVVGLAEIVVEGYRLCVYTTHVSLLAIFWKLRLPRLWLSFLYFPRM